MATNNDALTDPAGPPNEKIVRSKGGGRTMMYAVVAIIVVVLLVVLVAYGAGWLTPAKSKPAATGVNSCPTGQTLTGAGANFVLPIVSQWQSSFQTTTSNQVSYSAAGSGAGITDLTDKTVDFAATDDPLNASQTSALPSPVLTFPVTAGALAIVYNLPGVTTPISLSGAVLADIYLGTITNWNDSAISANNTGLTLPDQPIVTVHRSDGAGTTFVLSDFLSQESSKWSTTVGKGIQLQFPSTSGGQEAIKGNSALAAYVQAHSYTIGYVDLTDVLNTPGLQYSKILNPSGHYILPTLADTASAIANKSAITTFPTPSGNWESVSMVNSPGTGDYPLATFAYFYVFAAGDQGFSPSLAKSQVIQEWINWTITSGQSEAPTLYYVTLPAAVVDLDEAGLTSMTFNGQEIPLCG